MLQGALQDKRQMTGMGNDTRPAVPQMQIVSQGMLHCKVVRDMQTLAEFVTVGAQTVQCC